MSASAANTAGDTVKVVSSAAGPLLAAAGVASSAGPVGWVVGAVLAVAAAVVGTVAARQNAELRQAEAVEWARAANVPTQDVPRAFLVDLASQSREQMEVSLRALIRQHAQAVDPKRKADLWRRLQAARAAYRARFVE